MAENVNKTEGTEPQAKRKGFFNNVKELATSKGGKIALAVTAVAGITAVVIKQVKKHHQDAAE